MTLKLLNNRYQLVQALATGGFGQTFLAEDTHLPSRRRCVIKQLKPIAHNPKVYQLVQERFQREAAILEKLGNSNDQIPDLYAYFEEALQFYLVQEWIEGQTLTEKIQATGRMRESAVQDILVRILPVIDYIHSQGIIHRDIKPDNIILRQRDGKPVLIDFGAVKETMTTVVNAQGNPTNSMVIGTPGFMPSEQSAGRPIYSTDLYSLGLTAIYLLTGKLPQELEINRQTGEFIWRQNVPNINSNLGAVLDKAIQSHPRDRYSTASQMLDALHSNPAPNSPVNLSQQATVAVSPGGASTQPVQILNSSIRSGEWKKAAAIAGGIIGAALIISFAVAKTRQSALQQPVARQTLSPTIPPTAASPSPPQETTPETKPVIPKTPSPAPIREQTDESPSVSIPTRGEVPTFPVGTPESAVKQALGKPTKASKGLWNTRAMTYEDYIPGEVSLGYLYDPNSRQILQTEVSFAQSVDFPVMVKTVDELLEGRSGADIRQKLQRVYQRRSNRQTFATGSLKGEIVRNESDRIYIGIWSADLH